MTTKKFESNRKRRPQRSRGVGVEAEKKAESALKIIKFILEENRVSVAKLTGIFD